VDGWKTPTEGRMDGWTDGWNDANAKGIENTIDASSESNRGRWDRWFAPRVDFFKSQTRTRPSLSKANARLTKKLLFFISRFVGIGGHV
jgi:hypothetical protein